jgi:PAS domain S-box-containing protein
MPDAEAGQFGFGRLFDLIRDAVVVGEAERGRVVLWNRAAEAMLGYTRAEAIGMPLEAIVPERLRERHRAGLARYAATGRGPLIDAGHVLALPALRKDGTEIAVELSLNPLDDAPSGSRFVLAIVRDITERERLRAEAERAQFDGAQMTARRVAHEMKNVLMSVVGKAELLQDANRDVDTVRLAAEIAEGAVAAADIVDRLVRIDRFEQVHGSSGPMLDLERSIAPPDPAQAHPGSSGTPPPGP